MARHEAGLPPGLQALPGAPVEPEMIRRIESAPGRNVGKASALIGEAALLQHRREAGLITRAAGRDLIVLAIGEEGIDWGPRCLGGIALAPVAVCRASSRDPGLPVSGLGPIPTMPMRLLGLALGVMASCSPGRPHWPAGPEDESLRNRPGGMDAEFAPSSPRRLSHRPGVRWLGIRETGPAQPQAAGLEGRKTSSRVRSGNIVLLRSGRALFRA